MKPEYYLKLITKTGVSKYVTECDTFKPCTHAEIAESNFLPFLFLGVKSRNCKASQNTYGILRDVKQSDLLLCVYTSTFSN